MIDNNYKIDLVPFKEWHGEKYGKTENGENVIIQYALNDTAISVNNIVSIEMSYELYSNGKYFKNRDDETIVSHMDIEHIALFRIYTTVKDIHYLIYDESFTCIQDVLNYINECIHKSPNEKNI